MFERLTRSVCIAAEPNGIRVDGQWVQGGCNRIESRGREREHGDLRAALKSHVVWTRDPAIELKPGPDPATPEVFEGPRRLIGPFKAVFTVHVTGKSRMLV